MTPEQLALIAADGRCIEADPDRFAHEFYDALFECAPQVRSLFPDDLTEQRGKLVDELGFLVEAAATVGRSGTLDAFVERAHDLGVRHVGYGVAFSDYDHVGFALLAALRHCVADFGPEHEQAWARLYQLIADTMREAAAVVVADGRG